MTSDNLKFSQISHLINNFSEIFSLCIFLLPEVSSQSVPWSQFPLLSPQPINSGSSQEPANPASDIRVKKYN